MAQSTFLNDYRTLLAEEDIITVKKAADAIQAEFELLTAPAKDVIEDYNKIFNQTTLSLKRLSNSNYKATVGLEPSEIEHIKASLNNYACNDERVAEFKQQIIEDLSTFQKQIKTSYIEKIAEYNKKKQLCEKQIKVYENEKNKTIMERLSRIVWPYDEKTKELDNKIAALEIQAKQYEQKATLAATMRPVANEKEILIYEMQLKEKFGKMVKAA